MSKKRKPSLLHTLLVGPEGEADAHGVLVLEGDVLHYLSPSGELRPCPPRRACGALIVEGVDLALVLGLRKPDIAEPLPCPQPLPNPHAETGRPLNATPIPAPCPI